MTNLAYTGISLVLRGYFMPPMAQGCSVTIAAMFDTSSRNFCSKPYQAVNSDPYAKHNCLQSNFVYERLTKGYGVPANKMIQVGNKLRGFDLGWTLGALLYYSALL